MNAPYLLLSLLFSTIGTGFFIYGKKQQNMMCFGVGAALVLYTFVVTNILLLILIGVALTAAPFVMCRYGR